MDIETRAAVEARQVLEYFEHLESLGKFAGESVDEQKLTFLIHTLVNFAKAGSMNERLRAWAEDEQAKRHRAEEKLLDARNEIERLCDALRMIAGIAAGSRTPNSLPHIACQTLV